MIYDTIPLSEDEADALVAFIKNHEREDIPDEVWDICMKLCDQLNRA